MQLALSLGIGLYLRLLGRLSASNYHETELRLENTAGLDLVQHGLVAEPFHGKARSS